MSTDYDVVCVKCRKGIHLGQRMAIDIYSFGFGSKDTETPPKIMRWIADHCEHDTLQVMDSNSASILRFDDKEITWEEL